MKKLLPLILILFLASCAHHRLEDTKGDTGLGTSPFSTGGTFTATQANAMNNAVNDNAGDIADLVTLSGVAANSENLGTFTGSTIADSSTIYAALQAIETAVEATTDDQTAAEVVNTPAGDIAAVTVQAALNELDTDKQAAATASTDTERLAHEYNTSVHNDTCVDGECGASFTGNTITFSRAIASGEFWIWAENIGGEWKLYRQGYNENDPTEIKGGYVDESGNFVMSGQIDFAGEVTAPTQAASDSSNRVATMAAVQAAIAAALGTSGVDSYPADYSFDDVADANVTTEYDDNMTVTDIDSTTSISISGGGGEYQINAGARTSTAGTVALNDEVTVYLESSSLNSTTTTTSLNVGGMIRAFNVTTAAGGGTTCTGGITFNWPMLADFVTTEDISTDNGGCSAGDLTVTLESSASGEDVSGLGSTGYALYIPGAYDTASFDLSSYDLWDYSAGTVSFDFRVATWANSGWLFSLVGESSQDEFIIMLYDGDDIRVQYEGSNAGPVRATTAAAGLVVDTWYHLEAKWRAGATDPSVSVTVEGITATATTDLTAFDTAPVEMNVGNASGVAPAFYIKNVRVYDSWQ